MVICRNYSTVIQWFELGGGGGKIWTCGLVIRVRVFLRRTDADCSDWRFENVRVAVKWHPLSFLLSFLLRFSKRQSTTIDNSSSQDFPHLDDQTTRSEITLLHEFYDEEIYLFPLKCDYHIYISIKECVSFNNCFLSEIDGLLMTRKKTDLFWLRYNSHVSTKRELYCICMTYPRNYNK